MNRKQRFQCELRALEVFFLAGLSAEGLSLAATVNADGDWEYVISGPHRTAVEIVAKQSNRLNKTKNTTGWIGCSK